MAQPLKTHSRQLKATKPRVRPGRIYAATKLCGIKKTTLNGVVFCFLFTLSVVEGWTDGDSNSRPSRCRPSGDDP